MENERNEYSQQCLWLLKTRIPKAMVTSKKMSMRRSYVGQKQYLQPVTIYALPKCDLLQLCDQEHKWVCWSCNAAALDNMNVPHTMVWYRWEMGTRWVRDGQWEMGKGWVRDLPVAHCCTPVWDLVVACAWDLVVACQDLLTQLIASHLPLLSNVFPLYLILCTIALVALENAKPIPTSFNIWTIHPQSASSSLRNSYKFLRPLDSKQDWEPARNQHQILQVLELMRKWMVWVYQQTMIKVWMILPLWSVITFSLIQYWSTLILHRDISWHS